MKFKLDTGAAVTAVPSRVMAGKALQPTERVLKGAGGQILKTRGCYECTVTTGHRSARDTIYVVDGLVEPLLGKSLIKQLDLIKFTAAVQEEGTWRVKYAKLFKGLGCLKQEYTIQVDNEQTPYATPVPRIIPAARKEAARAEINRMLDMGVIRPVDKPTKWCSPCVIVMKKTGAVRLCIDYTRLNEAVQREYHPMPSTEELLGELNGAKVFSKLDANSGYWQMPLSEESKDITTFITPFGRFQCNRLPFGISSAPEYFQKQMQRILVGIPNIVCLMDDILVYGKSRQEHDTALEKVLQRLVEAGLTLNSEKCVFTVDRVTFLGHVIDKDGISADPEKIRAISEFPAPRNRKEVKSFLGVVQWLGKFTPQLAQGTQAMRQLLCKTSDWTWGDQQKQEFKAVKEMMTSAPTLRPFDLGARTRVSTDASSFGLGAAILQEEEGQWLPVAFASRAMTATERRYAQVEKEALAICWAVEKFHYFLAGRKFEVETDHKPLVALLGLKELARLPLRLQRFRLRMLSYDYNIFYTPGQKLVLADLLSRDSRNEEPAIEGIVASLDDELTNQLAECLPISQRRLQQLRAKTASDELGTYLVRYCRGKWPNKSSLSPELQDLHGKREFFTERDGVVFHGSRIYIPQDERPQVLSDIHRAHQGESKCLRIAKEAVWWPRMTIDITQMVKECRKCMEHRAIPREPLKLTPLPEKPWWRLGMDLFEKEGEHFLVIVDYFSRYIVVRHLKETTSETMIREIESVWLLLGIPHCVITDNGPQYKGEAFRQLMQKWDIQHITSAPRNAQSNGEAERAVQTAKALMRKNVDWEVALGYYRDTPLSTGFSPAQLMFNRGMNTRGFGQAGGVDVALFKRRDAENKERSETNYNRRHSTKIRDQVEVGMPVMIQDPGQQPAPGTVVAAQGREVLVQNEKGSILRRNRKMVRLRQEETIPEERRHTSPMENQDAPTKPAREGTQGRQEPSPPEEQPGGARPGTITPRHLPEERPGGARTTGPGERPSQETGNTQPQAIPRTTRSGRASVKPARFRD